ncbi:major facilitator superfamily domain-containing protein [Aspergillus avenaceus]|uniref:Major facilitator superfamily domain-containing protein n=1 Tax=Aspergillus avenaceus TaxID=36643 RepID=A0A5N6U5U5_ASPAV|nr:major facilitator superfamily domain-containing protein [Aspergillus avenaceus]
MASHHADSQELHASIKANVHPESRDVVQPNESQDLDREVQIEPLHGMRLYAILIGIFIGALLMSLDVFVIATALPSIISEFRDTAGISWYPAAYSLTVCAVTPLVGKIATVFPLRWVYLSFFLVFEIGSAICGFAPNSAAFIAGRAIAGIGAAGVAGGGFTIVLNISSPESRPINMALISSCFGVGLILGPILGGALTQRATWRWCFWMNLPAGVVTLGALFLFFRPPQVKHTEGLIKRIRSLDLVGCAMFVPAIFMALMALQWGDSRGWSSATIIGLFVGAGVLLLIFAAWEMWKEDEAMIPAVALRRTVTISVLFAFCHMGMMTIQSYYLPQWFQGVKGVGALDSGVRMLPSVLAQIVGSVIAGAIAPRVRYYNPWFFVEPVLICIAAGLYTRFTPSTPTSHWIGFQVIYGLGIGPGMQMPSLAVQLALKDWPKLVPIGVSLLLFAQYLGATVLQVIGGTIFNTYLRRGLTDAGLTAQQVSSLLEAGTSRIHQTAEEQFPDRLDSVLGALNHAITRTFFAPIVVGGVGFLLSFGVEWNKIEVSGKEQDSEEDRNPVDNREDHSTVTLIPMTGRPQVSIDANGKGKVRSG